MSDTPSPVAGWYADPEDPSGERWWNGVGWSDHRRGSTVGSAPEAAPAAVTAPAAPDQVSAGEPAGFTFGAPGATPRPDPYAPPSAVSAGYAPGTYPAPGAYPAPGTYSAGGYAPASPYAPAPYGAPAYGSSSNGLAIGGLITSIGGFVIGFLAAIAGIILSGFALAQAKQREAAGNPNSGRGMAMAGLVVGIVALALNILVVVAYVAFMFSVTSSY